MAPMINAAAVAFLNAGSVPLNGIICAVAVVRKMGRELAVDSSEDKEEVEATGCFAFLVTRDLHHHGTTASCVHTSWKEG